MFYKTDSVGFHDVNSSGMPGVSFNLKNGNRFLLYVTDEDLRLYDQVERKQIWVKQDSLDRKVGYSYDSSDPDKLLYTGQASVNGAVYTNMPLPTWFSVYTMMVNGNEEFATQVAVTYIGAKLFVRGRNDGEWSDWVEKQLSLDNKASLLLRDKTNSISFEWKDMDGTGVHLWIYIGQTLIHKIVANWGEQLSLGQKLYIIDDAGVDDWNDLVSTGVFSVYAAKNSPIDNGRALWMSALVVRVNGNEQFVTQLAMVPSRGAYLRTRHTGEWSSWSEL